MNFHNNFDDLNSRGLANVQISKLLTIIIANMFRRCYVKRKMLYGNLLGNLVNFASSDEKTNAIRLVKAMLTDILS